MADFNLSAITSVVQPATHFFFENDKIVFTISASLLVLVTAAISRQFCQPKELKTRELKVLTEKEKFLKEKELKTRELKVLTEEEKFLKEVEKTIEETKRFIQEDRFSDRERNWLYYAWKEGAVGRYRDEWRKYIQGLRKFPDYLNILLKSEIDYSTIIFINKFLNPPEAVELIKRLQSKGKSWAFHEEDSIILLLLVNGDFESFEALGININKGLYRACELAIHGDRRSELPHGTCQLLRREPFYFVDWAIEMGANVDSMDNIRGDPCFHLAIQSEGGDGACKTSF